MKLETILNAMERARFKAAQIKGYKKHDRQYRAFRARILRLDAEKDATIKELDDWVKQHAYLVHIHKGGPK